MKSNGMKKIQWGKLTAAELAAATKEFDHPLPESRYKPATKADRARFERALRAGEKYRRIDPKLMKAAEAYAKRKKLSLSQLIERGLRRELAVQE
jgi:hypothetical protein